MRWIKRKESRAKEGGEGGEKADGGKAGCMAAVGGSRAEPGQDDIFLSSHYLILRLLLILRALPWLPHLSAP